MNAKELLALKDTTKLRDKFGDGVSVVFASQVKPIVVKELQFSGTILADDFASRFIVIEDKPVEGNSTGETNEVSRNP